MQMLRSSILALLLLSAFSPANGEPVKTAPPLSAPLPFKAGEKLTYEISWSDIVQAGTAVMEVREEKLPDGGMAYRFISTAVSTGLVSKFYKVSDLVESLVEGADLCPLVFRLDQHHGKREKKRLMTFDHEEGTVSVETNGKAETYTVPPDVQDSLSSLYYVRTKQDFTIGKPIIVEVHEDGKTWAVEVQTLGREKLKTAFGELDTIKIKTYPKFEGVFQHQGEIYIWLTDDARKIPVLMKSQISIGSILATLIEMKGGEEKK